MWGAGLWIRYVTMPIGLGLITMQYIVDLISLITGRQPPFGLEPRQTAEDVARAQARQALGDL
jgi:TRAP-type C4-dicarboxylate transport system permease small subunit